MGRKQNQKAKKHSQQEQEQSVEEDFQDDLQQEQDFQDEDQQDEQDMVDQSVLLKKIQDKIIQCEQQEKLSWGAIYSLKGQQSKLNQQMQKQIDTIKEKYQKLKTPIMNKISDVISGKKLDKNLYADCQFTKGIDINKTKPKALKDYWGKVFESCGLIGNQEDINLLQSLTSFKCQILDATTHTLKISMQFEQNQYFEKSIDIKISGRVADGNFTKKVTFVAKKDSVIDQNSLFGLLTSSNSDDQQLQQTCFDLYRAYISSVYFYFFSPEEGMQGFGNQQGQKNQDDDQQQQSDQQDQQDVKPVKKAKGSAITQKPECKQQ